MFLLLLVVAVVFAFADDFAVVAIDVVVVVAFKVPRASFDCDVWIRMSLKSGLVPPNPPWRGYGSLVVPLGSFVYFAGEIGDIRNGLRSSLRLFKEAQLDPCWAPSECRLRHL